MTAHTSLKFKLRTSLLARQHFVVHNTSTNIYDVLKCVCDNFKIKEKVRYVVMDNSGNMLKAFMMALPNSQDQPESQAEEEKVSFPKLEACDLANANF